MTIHIGAQVGEIADTILLPGDPLRAKYIAENFLENAKCYNQVRGMLGFTGTYKGRPISVQGTGMGIPSISIYTYELINTYKVKNLVRIGSCGAIRKEIKLRDIILGMSASTDSATLKRPFQDMTYAPTASFPLLKKAYDTAMKLGIAPIVGNVLSSDTFYDEEELWKVWAKYGVLAVEMEMAGLYSLAARFGVNALGMLTVSDHLMTHEACSAEERQLTFDNMIKVALEMFI